MGLIWAVACVSFRRKRSCLRTDTTTIPMTRRHFTQALTTALLAAPEQAGAVPLWSRAEPHMGCLWTLTLPDLDPAAAEKAAQAVFAEIARLNGIFSDYEPASELNRLCDQAGKDIPVPVSTELFDILQQSKAMSGFSGGVFDITLAPCVRLWRRSRRRGELPDNESLTKARARTGWQAMKLDAAARTVHLAKPGMQLDLGGIAKGWTQDACLKLLRDRFKITAVLLDAAGQVAAGDPPAGRDSWQIALQAMPDGSTDRIPLRGANVATSGNHYQFVEIGSRRYSHLIDPRTGLGSTVSRQASVIAATGSLADALTKLCCLMEPEASLALIRSRYPEVQIRISQAMPDGTLITRQTGEFPAKAE